MQDGRYRLINRADLLLRLMEWQTHRSKKMERQIVGKNNERGREKGEKRGGRERFIIWALNVIFLMLQGFKALLKK